MEFTGSEQQEHGRVPSANEMHVLEGGLSGGVADAWPRHVSGAESDDLSGVSRQARHAAQRGHGQDHRRGLATDPEIGGGGVPFAFQVDDGRLPTGGGGGGMLGGSSLSSPLDWMRGGLGGGVEDPKGVHKRSLNGTSKGVSPAGGVTVGTSGDQGDLIRRVACDEPPGVLPQQPSQVI